MTLSNDAKLVTFINVFTLEPLKRMMENVRLTRALEEENRQLERMYAESRLITLCLRTGWKKARGQVKGGRY
jgi:hypothetical protein